MIIIGVAIIVFSLEKKKKRSSGSYVNLSKNGAVRGQRKVNYGRRDMNNYADSSTGYGENDKFDTLFSKKKEDKKGRYRRIMDRRKNVRPGEVEIPMGAWGAKGKGQEKGIPAVKGKYGHLFSSDSAASTSKLAKLKKRAMDVYEDQHNEVKSEIIEKEDKPSIFSMFGGGDENRQEETTPATPPETNPPIGNGFAGERREEERPYPYPQRETVPSSNIPNNNRFGAPPETRIADTNPVEPNREVAGVDNQMNASVNNPANNREDEISRDEAFNRMLNFGSKKDEKEKKKDNDEWTPMF